MAGRNIGPTIGLGGEAEFRTQIKNINAEIGVLQAQLEKTAVSFEGNEKSEEALSEKTKILTQMNEQLEKAVEATKKQHDEVAEKYGENSNAALKLEKDLIKLEKQIIQNNNAIDDNTSVLDENEEALNENADKVSFWSQEVQNQYDAAKETINNALNGIKEGLSSLNDMVTESGEKADEILNASQKVGMSAQSYQELQYAASQLNIDVGTLTDSMKDLGEKAFDAAKDPASEAAELFRELGVSVTDTSGNLRDSQEIWTITLEALGNMSNETEKNAVAAKLFGGAANELSMFMGTQGIQSLQMYQSEARNLGIVLDNDTIRSLDALNETQREADATIQGVKDRISAQLAPSFAQASEAAAQLLLAFEPLITDALSWALEHVPEIATGVGALVASLIALKMVSVLTPLINLMNTSLMQTNATLTVTNATLMTNPVVLIVTGVVGAVAGLVAGIALFNDKTDEISDGMDDMARGMESVGDSADKLEEGMEEVANSIDWEAINLDFEAKFAILGANSASAFKKNLLEGFNGFENDLTSKLSGMNLEFSATASAGGKYTPVISSTPTQHQTIDISLYLDKYKVAEILFDPLTGVAKQKGVT